ncbi:MAG: hypothetical protein EOM59_15430 [Clostridia bacterium]|nr:hypothetical protein [Clostridia bacterium]
MKQKKMEEKYHNLVLAGQELFVLYFTLIESRQRKEAEYERNPNPKLLKDVEILRTILSKTQKLIVGREC